jgi:hypothetical protein
MKFMMTDFIKGLQKDFILSTSCKSTNMLTKLPGAFQLAKKKAPTVSTTGTILHRCTLATYLYCWLPLPSQPSFNIPSVIYSRYSLGGKKKKEFLYPPNKSEYPPSRTAQEKGDRDVVCTA